MTLSHFDRSPVVVEPSATPVSAGRLRSKALRLRSSMLRPRSVFSVQSVRSPRPTASFPLLRCHSERFFEPSHPGCRHDRGRLAPGGSARCRHGMGTEPGKHDARVDGRPRVQRSATIASRLPRTRCGVFMVPRRLAVDGSVSRSRRGARPSNSKAMRKRPRTRWTSGAMPPACSSALQYGASSVRFAARTSSVTRAYSARRRLRPRARMAAREVLSACSARRMRLTAGELAEARQFREHDRRSHS